MGPRAHIYGSLGELTLDSSAVVIARPTGKTFTKPFPGGGLSTPYVRMSVARVLDGAVNGKEVAVVDPGIDVHTGKSALLSSNSYLLYLAPAMYDRNRPAGGYAVVGGPAGVYSQDGGSATRFVRIDSLSAGLPARIDVTSTKLPAVTKTAEQLLAQGPR